MCCFREPCKNLPCSTTILLTLAAVQSPFAILLHSVTLKWQGLQHLAFWHCLCLSKNNIGHGTRPKDGTGPYPVRGGWKRLLMYSLSLSLSLSLAPSALLHIRAVSILTILVIINSVILLQHTQGRSFLDLPPCTGLAKWHTQQGCMLPLTFVPAHDSSGGAGAAARRWPCTWVARKPTRSKTTALWTPTKAHATPLSALTASGACTRAAGSSVDRTASDCQLKAASRGAMLRASPFPVQPEAALGAPGI